MNALEFTRALAEATDAQAAAIERGNQALDGQAERLGRLGRLGPPPPSGQDMGGQGGRSAGLRTGIARDTSGAGTTSRTIQGPNGLEIEILGPNGEVLSIVPTGPQSEPRTEPFFQGGGSAGAGADAAAKAPNGAAPATAPAPAGGNRVAPGVLPEGSQRSLTGTAGGKTVVAALAVLQQYCKLTEITVPDSSVPGASPTKGPSVRRSIWECPKVPLILPEGGVFMEEERVAGGLGGGFIGIAPTSESGTAGSINPPKGGYSFGAHIAGHASGVDASGNPMFGASSAPPSPPAAPTPGERAIADSTKALAVQVGRLAEKLNAKDGGLSLRAKGLTL